MLNFDRQWLPTNKIVTDTCFKTIFANTFKSRRPKVAHSGRLAPPKKDRNAVSTKHFIGRRVFQMQIENKNQVRLHSARSISCQFGRWKFRAICANISNTTNQKLCALFATLRKPDPHERCESRNKSAMQLEQLDELEQRKWCCDGSADESESISLDGRIAVPGGQMTFIMS